MRPVEGLEELGGDAAAGGGYCEEDEGASDVVGLALDRREVGVEAGVGVLLGALDVGWLCCGF